MVSSIIILPPLLLNEWPNSARLIFKIIQIPQILSLSLSFEIDSISKWIPWPIMLLFLFSCNQRGNTIKSILIKRILLNPSFSFVSFFPT